MKNSYLKIAMMTVFVLTLLAGSALASPLEVYWGGTAILLDNENTETSNIFDAYYAKVTLNWYDIDGEEADEYYSYSFEFQFRDKDKGKVDLIPASNEYYEMYHDTPFDFETIDFGEVNGINFSAKSVDMDFTDENDYWISYMEDLEDNSQFLNMYLTGWADFTPYTYGIYISFYDSDTKSWNIGVTGSFDDTYTNDASAVPEPGSILLLGTGMVGLGFAARRRFGKK